MESHCKFWRKKIPQVHLIIIREWPKNNPRPSPSPHPICRNFDNSPLVHFIRPHTIWYKSTDTEPKSKITKRLFQKYVRNATLIFLHHQISRIMRDHWYGCKYDRQRKHDCVILGNEKWWNKHGKEAFKSIDFHLIHHQAINRLYEHFLFLKLKMISQLKRPFRVCKWRSIHCLKCVWPYSEFFWSVFSRIWTEYGEILRE